MEEAPVPSRWRRTSAQPEGVVETSALWRILWFRRRWIGLAALLAAACALIFCLLTPVQYTATVQILVDPREKQAVANDLNSNATPPDGGIAAAESQLSVLQSNGVLLRAIASTQLDADPEFNSRGALGKLLGVFNIFRGPDDAKNVEDDLKSRTLAALRKHIKAKRAEKVLVLDLSVDSRDRDKSVRIANAIADAYLADQADARAEAGREASRALAARLGELEDKVRSAENAVEDYRARNKLVVSSGQLVSDQQLNEATLQLSAAQNRAATLKAQLDQLRRGFSSQGTPEATQSAVIVRLRDRESALVEKLADIGKQLGPRHPEYISVDASLRHVRALIGQEVDRLEQAVRADYERAAADQRALAGKLDAMKSRSLDDDKTDVELRELQREAEAARTVYANFLLRAKETSEQSNLNAASARVITRGLRPQQSSWPPYALLIFGAAGSGLLLGASGSLAYEYVRPVLMSASQVREIADAPVLGVFSLKEPPSGPRLNPVSQATPRERLDPAAFRVTQLLMLSLFDGEEAVGRRPGRCLIVASAPSDATGRSLVAESIAAVATRNGKEVLLIDADLSGETQADAPGFLDLLRGEHEFKSVCTVSEDGYLMMGKGLPDAPGASSRRHAEAAPIERAIRFFDLTIIDAGALSRNYRMASIVARSDLILLVAELGHTLQAAAASEIEAAALMGSAVGAVALIDRTIVG